MNILFIVILKLLRKFHTNIFGSRDYAKLECDQDPDSVSQKIIELLNSDTPCMIARFGSTELSCLSNYIGVHHQKNKVCDYIRGITNPWWWEPKILIQMQWWSGFFPPTVEKIEQFCKLMIQDIPKIDILGSWLPQESSFNQKLGKHQKVSLELLNPFFAEIPWTVSLTGKNVLVIHPFTSTIMFQYKKRTLLFDKNILPDFNLKTIKAVQSSAGENTSYGDWFEALEWMKGEIDKQEYDICLIGAGAYGLHLAAHVKRQGKKAVHLGGSLQLLFGIRGKRWENKNYNPIYNYQKLMNEHWLRPDKLEKPNGAKNVEGGCYW